MTRRKKQSDSFNENYATLKKIAEQMKHQETPDIDGLVPLVEEATAAYKACRTRITAVKAALDEKFVLEPTEQNQPSGQQEQDDEI